MNSTSNCQDPHLCRLDSCTCCPPGLSSQGLNNSQAIITIGTKFFNWDWKKIASAVDLKSVNTNKFCNSLVKWLLLLQLNLLLDSATVHNNCPTRQHCPISRTVLLSECSSFHSGGVRGYNTNPDLIEWVDTCCKGASKSITEGAFSHFYADICNCDILSKSNQCL